MKLYNFENKFQEIKQFMFSVIQKEFGYDINPDWHWDILNLGETYTSNHSILCAIQRNSRIIGTIAARPYDKHYPEFAGKYTNQNTLGIWRHYIDKRHRGQGLGTKLLNEVENFAKEKGFKYCYLHTQKSIPGSLEYWLAKGYYITIESQDKFQTVHLEKRIN